jgi:hypothetical protein
MAKQWSDRETKVFTKLVKSGLSDVDVAEKLTKKFGREVTEASVRAKRKRLGLLKPEPTPKTFDEQVDLEAQRLRDTQAKRAHARDVREEARHKLLLETIAEAVRPLRFVQPEFDVPDVGGTEEQVVLDLSDLHFGKKTDTYDMQEAERRLKSLVRSLMKIVALHRHSYPINVLNILWGGDIVDGDAIYPTQSHHRDGHTINQIFTMAPAVAKQLAVLAGFFKQVNNYCVRGNHGRASRFAHEDDNFDTIFYYVLQASTQNIPNMTWDIAEGWYQIVPILNTRVLLVHGHQIKMTLNLPWYGITTRISRWATTEQVGAFDVACLHHFHTSSRLRWNQKQVFTNGTLVSGDEFALEVLGLESSQCQWLFSVHPKRGVTWAYELVP